MSKGIKKLAKKYTELDLYKQGAAAKFLYLSYPWIACFEPAVNRRPAPVAIDYLLCFAQKDLLEVWWSKKGLEKIARFYFNKNLRNPDFINNLHNHWQKHDLAGVLALARQIEAADLSGLSRAELVNLANRFGRVYTASWREAIFLDSFDFMGEPLLEEILKKHGLNLSAEDLRILTSAAKPSSLQTEKKELLNLASLVQKNRKLKQAIAGKNGLSSLARRWPAIFRSLQKHARAWHWIYNDYAVVKRLDEKFFLKTVRIWLRRPGEFYQEKKALAALSKLGRKQRQLSQQRNLPQEVRQAVALLAVLSVWREKRKTHCQIANSAIRLLAAEFARRSGVPLVKAENLFWWELSRLFTSRKRALIRIGLKRRQGSFFEGRLDTDPIHFGRAARQPRSAVGHPAKDNAGLAGRPAFAGQAVGRVRIVLAQAAFKKMKPGDILVAHNTRPEYVPIMKIAGAIVTVEGGITSHAAIMARELGVPCVIGVQNALTALQDGDKVEVDAEQGVVRKL